MTQLSVLPILAIITVKNEARNIAATITSALRVFCSVVVVDSNSTDGTPEICRMAGVECIDFTWNGNYPKKKQWCLDQVCTQHRWVFFLDGDEQVTPELHRELLRVLPGQGPSVASAYEVPIAYHFGGRRLYHGYVPRKTVLLDREQCTFPDVGDINAPGMGELEGHYQPQVRGRTIRLQSELHHEDLDGIGSWIERHCRYADWEAYVRVNPGTRTRINRLKTRQGRLFDTVPGKSITFFTYCYVVKCGFRDGRPGFDYAMGLSFYRWQISVKTRELRRIADAHP